MTTRRTRWPIGAAIALAVLATAPAGDARPAAIELPTPTVSSTDVHLGDTITIAGTGCIDPGTSTADGVALSVVQFNEEGRPTTTDPQALAVAADGSYAGPFTIGQPVPNGTLQLLLRCTTERGTDIGSTMVAIQASAPALADLVVVPGTTATLPYPCSSGGGGFGIFLEGAPPEVAWLEPSDGLGAVGQIMHLEVPAALPPGDYDGEITCRTDVVGAYFNIRVIVTAPGSVSTQPAAPAEPQAGSSDYTG